MRWLDFVTDAKDRYKNKLKDFEDMLFEACFWKDILHQRLNELIDRVAKDSIWHMQRAPPSRLSWRAWRHQLDTSTMLPLLVTSRRFHLKTAFACDLFKVHMSVCRFEVLIISLGVGVEMFIQSVYWHNYDVDFLFYTSYFLPSFCSNSHSMNGNLPFLICRCFWEKWRNVWVDWNNKKTWEKIPSEDKLHEVL